MLTIVNDPLASMTGVISDDLASNQSCVIEVFFPKVARAMTCMVSRRISHFYVAESLGCGAPNSLSKASTNCDMRFGCDILLTSIRGLGPLFLSAMEPLWSTSDLAAYQ